MCANEECIDFSENDSVNNDTSKNSSITLASGSIHKFIIKRAALKFFSCSLKTSDDFNIFVDNNDTTLGYFQCKICPKHNENYKMCKFRFTKYGCIQFMNILVHLKKHYVPSDCEPLRRGRKKTLFKTSKNASKQEKPVEFTDFNMCDEKFHRYVSDMASEKFESCRLKINKDFNLYKDAEDPLLGYFVCKLCAESSQPRNQCKFRFTKYHSLNFTNIQFHLLSHFAMSDVRRTKRGRKRKQIKP